MKVTGETLYIRILCTCVYTFAWSICQGYVDASPETVFDQLVVRMTETSNWNPAIVEGKVW